MSSVNTLSIYFTYRVGDEYPFIVSDEYPVVITDGTIPP